MFSSKKLCCGTGARAVFFSQGQSRSRQKHVGSTKLANCHYFKNQIQSLTWELTFWQLDWIVLQGRCRFQPLSSPCEDPPSLQELCWPSQPFRCCLLKNKYRLFENLLFGKITGLLYNQISGLSFTRISGIRLLPDIRIRPRNQNLVQP